MAFSWYPIASSYHCEGARQQEIRSEDKLQSSDNLIVKWSDYWNQACKVEQVVEILIGAVVGNFRLILRETSIFNQFNCFGCWIYLLAIHRMHCQHNCNICYLGRFSSYGKEKEQEPECCWSTRKCNSSQSCCINFNEDERHKDTTTVDIGSHNLSK